MFLFDVAAIAYDQHQWIDKHLIEVTTIVYNLHMQLFCKIYAINIYMYLVCLCFIFSSHVSELHNCVGPHSSTTQLLSKLVTDKNIILVCFPFATHYMNSIQHFHTFLE